MTDFRVLAINPGNTSTKIGVYAGDNLVFTETIRHRPEELAGYPDIYAQKDLRCKVIRQVLEAHREDLSGFGAIAGRGGLLKPMDGGVYLVDERLLADLSPGAQGDHAANLGGIIAFELGRELGLPAYVVDPVAVDEFEPLARYSGLPELPRRSLSHALNMKAVARRFARERGQSYGAYNLVVVHLGSGISVAAHQRGRIVDSTNANEDGPFSSERAGGVPSFSLVELATSGRYEPKALLKRLVREGGLLAYLGTNNAEEVEERIAGGDDKAREVYEALAYQVAKYVGSMAAVLSGEVDAILITGGMAYSALLTGWITGRVKRFAPVYVYPGEDELLALAEGALRVLTGEESPKRYDR